MRTVLVITADEGVARVVRDALSTDLYRVVPVQSPQLPEGLDRPGMVDAILLDADLDPRQPCKLISRLRRQLPDCALIVLATAQQGDWVEEAWTLGITHLLAKPLRGRVASTLLERLWSRPPPMGGAAAAQEPSAGGAPVPVQSLRSLEALRDFSSVLANSLRTETLLRHFLMLLRQITGVNRAAIFLRAPPPMLKGPAREAEERGLAAACALGLPGDLLRHFGLSLDTGIGRFARLNGRVLRRDAPEAATEPEARKEFEVLGVEVAVPILDRESLLGVAVLDKPVTGQGFANEQLTLIFHLLEELGLAVRNSWLHDQLAASHRVMTDILNHMGSACVMLGTQLEVLHANSAAYEVFLGKANPSLPMEFCHLPQPIGTMAYQAFRPGASVQTTRYHPSDRTEQVFEVRVIPFPAAGAPAPHAVLVLAEDITIRERNRLLEMDMANLRLVSSMAEHFAHEIGNSLAPVSAHQQMMGEHFQDAEFRSSFSSALASAVQRINRLSKLLRFLAEEHRLPVEKVGLAALAEEAFAEARALAGGKPPELRVTGPARDGSVPGNRAGLRQALAELLLNACQAASEAASIEVRIEEGTNELGQRQMMIEVLDSGPGFSPEAIRRATEPFFSTKTVGLGLGLTVARKIVEHHGGRLEIAPGSNGHRGRVRVRLPAEARRHGTEENRTLAASA
jgi:signal transduction histidine kinase/DNA-binding response OmpR family regulator